MAKQMTRKQMLELYEDPEWSIQNIAVLKYSMLLDYCKSADFDDWVKHPILNYSKRPRIFGKTCAYCYAKRKADSNCIYCQLYKGSICGRKPSTWVSLSEAYGNILCTLNPVVKKEHAEEFTRLVEVMRDKIQEL